MNIFKRLSNLWKLSEYKISGEANSRLSPRFLVKDSDTKQPPNAAKIVEMEKPNMFPNDQTN